MVEREGGERGWREGGSGAREGGQRAPEAYSGFVSWKDQPTAEQAAGTPQRRDVFSKINSRACKNRPMNVHRWLDMLLFLSSTSVASHPCSAVYNASTCRKSGVTSFPVVAAWLLCTINSGGAEPLACSLHMTTIANLLPNLHCCASSNWRSSCLATSSIVPGANGQC